nr:AsmA family protein [Luteimonas yindakuii]
MNPMSEAPAPTPSARRRRTFDTFADHPWRTALAVAAVGVLILILLWDWNWFKRPVERAVEARTGRSFTIGGDLDVDLGRVTTIRADALDLGNAEWSDEARMAAADRLDLSIEVLPLLRGQVRIPEIRLQRPQVRLEIGPDREGNWSAFAGDGGGTPIQLRRLWIDDGTLLFLDPEGETEVDVRVASQAPGENDAAPPVAITGEGRWRAAEFELEGTAQSPLDLQDTDSPYRFDLHARAGATRAHARGSLLDAFQFETFGFQMALAGRNLEHLYPLLGLAMPPTPPYSVDGQLQREGTTWHYRDFSGKVGDSDLAGSVTVETGGERNLFKADLVSKLLDLDDLAGFLGGAPESGAGETPSPAQEAEASSSGLIPDTPYELDKLNAMDADVRLRAQRIEADLPLDDMDAHLFLENGVLRLEPLNFGVAGGDIRSTVRMDARKSPIRTTLDADVRGLNLGGLFPDSTLAGDAVGRIGGHAKLVGNGNSIAAMLGSSDGELAIGMGKGEISALLVELAGIDIAEALAFLVTRDRKIPIRCAFAEFAVADGVMTSNALAFDTTDTLIVGEGTIDLESERLDLLLRPRPKDRSILSLRSPLVIGGTFSDPSFRPDLARLGLRGAIALALGSIAPPAALLATLELGPGEDSDCGGEYAR